MSLSSWSPRQIGRFWLAAAFVSLLCLIIGRLRNPSWEFAVLLPYDGTIRSIIRTATMLLRLAFVERPWEATALVVVPCVALAVSVVWLAARLRVPSAG